MSFLKEAIIKKDKGGFKLMSHKGKVLGQHKSVESAQKQEKAIWANKKASYLIKAAVADPFGFVYWRNRPFQTPQDDPKAQPQFSSLQELLKLYNQLPGANKKPVEASVAGKGAAGSL